jgi:hypothetical protein
LGTVVGSINFYDLKNYEVNTYRQDELNYPGLLKQLNPSSADDGETNFSEKLSALKARFSI